ncbi:DUF2269 family protein [Nesterenkonia flava]|uniref:DUF2269 family protein n=1 Tax=Nesterenkonia flava TaxID=469799 RepID=A0ABU1FSU2_9MICC|nr:DUF2269 family protein [Nesterenkonia flava]MDR5711733.1 hypothetical protein [Nesterenkonia flava]
MSNFLLSIHVLGAILAIGPVAVAASMFPPAARRALADPADARAGATVRILHRITRVYAVIGILVPVFGVATAVSMGILTQPWLLVSMTLTALAAAVLITQVIPAQKQVVEGLEQNTRHDDGDVEGAASKGAASATGATTMTRALPDVSLARRLGMTTGVFNLLWAVVVVMMIYRPGQGGYA